MESSRAASQTLDAVAGNYRGIFCVCVEYFLIGWIDGEGPAVLQLFFAPTVPENFNFVPQVCLARLSTYPVSFSYPENSSASVSFS